MMAYKNVSKPLTVLLALLMCVTAFAAIAADSSDASDISASGFKVDKNGTLTIPLNGLYVEGGTYAVVVTEEMRELYNHVFTADEVLSDPYRVEAHFSMSLGDHNINVSINGITDTITVHVEDNVWAHVSVYIMLVILAIVVIVIVVLYMRSRPNNKPTTTFTQLEEEKKAAAAASASGEPAAPAKTEKKKYTGSSSEGTGKIKYTSSRRK